MPFETPLSQMKVKAPVPFKVIESPVQIERLFPAETEGNPKISNVLVSIEDPQLLEN